MLVKCIANSGEYLAQKTVDVLGGLRTSRYPLNINDIYTVYGVTLWKGILAYLTVDKYNSLPFWNPVELFEIADARLPNDWYFSFKGYGEQLKDENWRNAICGYKELVTIETHSQDLIDRNKEAIYIFIKRRKEIEEFHSNISV